VNFDLFFLYGGQSMVAKRLALAVLVTLTILAMMAPMSYGQGLSFFGPNSGATCGAACDPCGQGFWMGLGVRKYINSFTSFEFPGRLLGNTNPPGKARFEWPLDQLFGVVRLGYDRGPVGVVVDYMATCGSGSGTRAQETYWDVDDGTVTLFGKGRVAPRSYVLDIGFTYALPVAAKACEEPPFGLAAIVGFRQQTYRYTMKDSTDNIPGATVSNRGDDIDFGQYYTHWYIGGIFTKAFDLASMMGGCYPPQYRFLFAFQADYAYVKANNNAADYVHWIYYSTVAREANNWQRTKGGCWHLNASLAMDAGHCLKIILEGDFKRIDTRGRQELSYFPGSNPFTAEWSGGKSWSDQTYVGILASYGF
jgi:hypothetical protein